MRRERVACRSAGGGTMSIRGICIGAMFGIIGIIGIIGGIGENCGAGGVIGIMGCIGAIGICGVKPGIGANGDLLCDPCDIYCPGDCPG